MNAALAYWRGGLTARGTRFEAMQQIIRGMLRHPEEFGLADLPSDRQVGEAVARWLSTSGHHSADWTANPSIAAWTKDAGYWASKLRDSESKVRRGLQTQIARPEAELIFDVSANGIDLGSAAGKRHRLNRELTAFGLINKAKHARIEHRKPLGRSCEVRLGARAVLAKLPGASMETYTDHLRWMEATGIIHGRDRGYSKARGLAKVIMLDLDPAVTTTEAEMQMMFDIHRRTKFEISRIAHALHLVRHFTDQDMTNRYGAASPKMLADMVRTAVPAPVDLPVSDAGLVGTVEAER